MAKVGKSMSQNFGPGNFFENSLDEVAVDSLDCMLGWFTAFSHVT